MLGAEALPEFYPVKTCNTDSDRIRHPDSLGLMPNNMLKMLLKIILVLLVLLIAGLTGMLVKLAADSRAMNVPSGLVDGRLRQCPPSPNCVTSDTTADDSHYIAPIADADGSRWARLVERISAMDGTELVTAETNYAHFTFRTPLLGFMDDVEFHHQPGQQVIAVRSASRVGYGDMNTNRKRIDTLRTLLAE